MTSNTSVTRKVLEHILRSRWSQNTKVAIDIDKRHPASLDCTPERGVTYEVFGLNFGHQELQLSTCSTVSQAVEHLLGGASAAPTHLVKRVRENNPKVGPNAVIDTYVISDIHPEQVREFEDMRRTLDRSPFLFLGRCCDHCGEHSGNLVIVKTPILSVRGGHGRPEDFRSGAYAQMILDKNPGGTLYIHQRLYQRPNWIATSVRESGAYSKPPNVLELNCLSIEM